MRKHWFAFLCVALLAAGLVALLLWPRDGPASRARCERVQVGMTLEEVEAVLGGPPGDYQSGEVYVVLTNWDFPKPEAELVQYQQWQGNDGLFWVCFDEQGRVTMSRLVPGHRITVLDKLRTWLGL